MQRNNWSWASTLIGHRYCDSVPFSISLEKIVLPHHNIMHHLSHIFKEKSILLLSFTRLSPNRNFFIIYTLSSAFGIHELVSTVCDCLFLWAINEIENGASINKIIISNFCFTKLLKICNKILNKANINSNNFSNIHLHINF